MDAESLINSTRCPPLVISDMINAWEARRWNIDYISSELADRKFSCKISSIAEQEMAWETDCCHLIVTMAEFNSWRTGNLKAENPLTNIRKEDNSCYVDYKYMKDMFDGRDDLLQAVDWGVFGFPDKNGKDSTIWIGTEGSYTNCHYDTYGFNLVAQIQGRKRWILFPPWETEFMYPTRIPYEESSVFSEVNLKCPNLQVHPKFQKVHPYVVVLEPGQVLYVPHHWWHFVESLEDSISINIWIEIEEDVESRVTEAITRCLFSSLLDTRCIVEGDNSNKWLNPGEENLDHTTNHTLLKATLSNSTEGAFRLCNKKLFSAAMKNVILINNENGAKKRKLISEQTDKRNKLLKSSGAMKFPQRAEQQELNSEIYENLYDNFSNDQKNVHAAHQKQNVSGVSSIHNLSPNIEVVFSENYDSFYKSGPGEKSEGDHSECTAEPWTKETERTNKEGSSIKNMEKLTVEKFCQCVLHPSVVSTIMNVLKDSL